MIPAVRLVGGTAFLPEWQLLHGGFEDVHWVQQHREWDTDRGLHQGLLLSTVRC